MYMGDRWNGSGNMNSQYVFLPITFSSTGAMQLKYYASWNLGMFTPSAIQNNIPGKTGIKQSDLRNGGKYAVYDMYGRKLTDAGANTQALSKSLKHSGIYIVAPGQGLPARIVVENKRN